MYNSHGDYEVKVHNRVILLKAWGMWNLERSRELVSLWQEEIVPLFGGQPWAYTMDLREWKLGGLDVFGEVTRLQKWNWKHDMARQAIVTLSGGLQSRLIRDLGRLMFDDRTAYFKDIDDSLNWLAEQGFPTADREKEPIFYRSTVKPAEPPEDRNRPGTPGTV